MLGLNVVLCSSVFAAVPRPQVTLNITGGKTGTIIIELYTDKAPVTCANFIKYVQAGFYNNLIFHRVVSGFMIQGGGFDQNLVYKTPTYPAIRNESYNRLSNLKYTVAMARTSDPCSATSQFFINSVDNTFLDYGSIAYNGGEPYIKVGYCVFGKVISGMTLVDSISTVTTSTQSGTQNGTPISLDNVPNTDIIIQSVTITLQAPVCETKLAGDINGDCKVNFKDIALLAGNWVQCNSLITATCSQN
jgi:peptidyl-prolyl cis-trans isomerase B (cyclophilin B)